MSFRIKLILLAMWIIAGMGWILFTKEPIKETERLGASLIESEIISKIQQIEDNYFLINQKYKHFSKITDWKTLFATIKDVSYILEINEYLKPDGQRGYWIVIENDNYIKSIGFGPDALRETWEYIKPPPFVNTTST